MRLVIALGGNAMTAADGRARPEDQRAAIERATGPLAELARAGHELVITHGNGPQVGNLLVKNEIAASIVPPVPLDWCGAQTQGTLGLLIMNALDRELAHHGSAIRTAALVSRTLVDAGDHGFVEPTKPIGRYLPESEARTMIEHGQVWQDRGERGWRRVVASPEPLECLDSPAAIALLAAGYVVVCSGGGGIPVVRGADGTLAGVEAVIDKDLTAALLAISLDADQLIIATDVPNVVTGFGTDRQAPIDAVHVSRLAGLAAAGEFGSGSMGPKVAAVCRFVSHTARPAVITSLEQLGRLAQSSGGGVGTVVLPDQSE